MPTFLGEKSNVCGKYNFKIITIGLLIVLSIFESVLRRRKSIIYVCIVFFFQPLWGFLPSKSATMAIFILKIPKSVIPTDDQYYKEPSVQKWTILDCKYKSYSKGATVGLFEVKKSPKRGISHWKSPNRRYPLMTNTTRVHMSKNERFWTVNIWVIQKAPLWGFLPSKRATMEGLPA